MFTEGTRVRVTRGPHTGALGVIVSASTATASYVRLDGSAVGADYLIAHDDLAPLIAKRNNPMKTITHNEYLQLVGLLALAAHHCAMLDGIERSALAITGEESPTGGHTSEAVWSGGLDVQQLLDRLQITIVGDEPGITPGDAGRQGERH